MSFYTGRFKIPGLANQMTQAAVIRKEVTAITDGVPTIWTFFHIDNRLKLQYHHSCQLEYPCSGDNFLFSKSINKKLTQFFLV